MVIVTIRDSLDSSKLGYKYADVSESDNLWINYEPLPPHKPSEPWNPSHWPAVVPSGNNTIGKVPSSFKLERRAPTKKDLKGKGLKHLNQLQEEIVLEKVRIPHSAYARFDVFINFPEAKRETHLYMSDVGQALRRLGIADWNTDVVVTIVSKGVRRTNPTIDFYFSDIKQDFQ
ncbi:hypothetical protein AXG93_1976s1090 [Marchantia polymorpha subsp. ruderalis]|uniref:Polyphenol oxidase central domain-containing protein n=1 Tax=Marchantia polymorpha subsp. ruderalis TaxID=1480154 RepID=A0A176VG67_MARPO|nr:hypothetical protein AXG93_1976s1090 [Marchantia polymorpha subsp. ruderalis]